MRLSGLIQQKVAWETYLDAARALKLFEGLLGTDLLNRLRDADDTNFRSAMAECEAAWFLAGKLHFKISPRPPGRSGRTLEFLLKRDNVEISTEVKAPGREITGNVWWGDDSDLLQQALESANKQFEEGTKNLLVLVPHLRTHIWADRKQLTKALIGDSVISIPIDLLTGEAGETSTKFKPSGHFLRVFRPEPKPRFTRVGAILSIEESFNSPKVDHRAYVVHNPYAQAPIPSDLWNDIPQFERIDDKIGWSDGTAFF
jgi:hypothetical protein